MEIYVVKQGDTLNGIAATYGVNQNTLIYDNQLNYPYQLAVGQSLLISNGQRNRTMEVRSNGYAYPFISEWVLDNTLPFLSVLSVFSYGFTISGELVPPILDDVWMVERALQNRVMPILTLTPLDMMGNFNNNLISAVVRNSAVRDNLINGLLEVMETKRYEGLDIDFEFIKAEDRDYFTEFVRECTTKMHEAGYQVSVALAPKTSAMQKGLLYEGKDYKAIGEIADHVLLMTYEWGYTYGPPMAVAPLNMVRRVVEYAVTEIVPEKISLGIPNYGYDWPLPYKRGMTRARTIGNVEAVQLALSRGAEIKFDELAVSPYFNYDNDGIMHEVWFEDVRSLQGKFDLIKEFRLRGAGYWQIMQLFRANWLLLQDNFYILKGGY
ncbi:MAG: LysM peptidoglycan-binding domain-containing protein [Lachnospiraceae bacterium]|nr:LysM peptidoglycan-binding domain-containing protein [Lachnospiraceae bacterium]